MAAAHPLCCELEAVLVQERKLLVVERRDAAATVGRPECGRRDGIMRAAYQSSDQLARLSSPIDARRASFSRSRFACFSAASSFSQLLGEIDSFCSDLRRFGVRMMFDFTLGPSTWAFGGLSIAGMF